MTDQLLSPSELKEKLLHTWEALLARFGRFTQIQARAIEPLLEGKNCLLISATSSGKTEAALAPLLERHLNNNKNLQKQNNKLSILYISPTRALVYDLNARLQGAMKKLAIKMQVKTGDDPALSLSNLPDLLITTPESFDSLLVNKPRIAKDIHTVILDEIHLYDNTPRGDQLRILLNRLRRIKQFARAEGDIVSDELQFCAMSATVTEPEKMAARYFENPVVISIPGQRKFSVELLPLLGLRDFISILNSLKDCRKVLCFCQKRVEAEEWGQEIKGNTIFGPQVFVHHSSLDRDARHNVEENFAKSPVAICFATSTLELGIDIGDLDLVVLIGAPDSTASFLQRIGRANRRKSSITTMCFYKDETEEALFNVFIQRAREGVNDESHYFFRHSVVVQQLCSYIKQTRLGEINPEQAYSLFASPTGQALINKPFYDEIIVHLVNKKFFTFSDRWTLKPAIVWQKLYEEHLIYSNISMTQTFDLIDDATGRKLGQIRRGTQEGDIILFAGQSRRVVRRLPGRVIVQTERTREQSTTLAHHSSYKTLSSDIVKAVAKELQLHENKTELNLPIYPDPEKANTYLILHCLGEASGFVLAELLENNYALIVTECDWLSLIIEGTLPGKISFSREQIYQVINHNWKRLESLFEFGAYHKNLPEDVRQTNILTAFNLDKCLDDINELFVNTY